MKTAVIYARVSSKEQEREGYSIPAQLEKCREFARKKCCRIAETFIDVESAKEPGRKQFNAMIRYVSENGINALIAHKVDRLCRNFKDFQTIDDLECTPLFVEEEFPDNASGKLTYGLKVLLAKHYIDNLSDEVKKGRAVKIARGEWPHMAPYGYRNSKAIGTIEIEPREAEIVLYLYKTFATGNFSLKTLRVKFSEDGFVYKQRNRIPAKGHIDRILKNPIYIGMMRIKDVVYPGKHEPIVSKELYDKVQAVFRAANKPKYTKKGFTFSGMMGCAKCGCAITAEIQKGRYVYYHCTGGRGGCDIQYVREEVLSGQYDQAVKGLCVDEGYYDLIFRTLRDGYKDEISFRKRAAEELRKRKELLESRMEKLYVDKLDGVIDDAMWEKKSREWKSEMEDIDRQMNTNPASAASLLDKGTRILEVGAGTGYYTMKFASAAGKLTAVDSNASMVEYLKNEVARQRISNIDIVPGDFLSFDGNVTYDWVIAVGVLEYQNEPSFFLDRLIAHSRKWVLVTLPTPGAWGRIYRTVSRLQGTRINLFSKSELKNRYNSSIVHMEDVGLKSRISGGLTLVCLIERKNCV